jgi:hypothetical protein
MDGGTKALTFVNSALAGWTVRVASVRPCSNASIITGSYVHSVLPSGKKLHNQLRQRSERAQLAIKAKYAAWNAI